MWDGGITETHLFVQKHNTVYTLYEVTFHKNAGRVEKYEYVIRKTNSMFDIASELSDFCKIRYDGTMHYDFNQLLSNNEVSLFFYA